MLSGIPVFLPRQRLRSTRRWSQRRLPFDFFRISSNFIFAVL